jgi:hypothetical protein
VAAAKAFVDADADVDVFLFFFFSPVSCVKVVFIFAKDDTYP